MHTNDSTQDDFGTIPIAEEPTVSPAKREEEPDITGQDPCREAAGPPAPPAGKRSRLLKAGGALLVFAILFLACGYLLVPHLTQTVFADRLGKRLNRPVTIAKAKFDPFSLTLTLQNLIVGPRLTDADDQVDPLLSVGKAKIDFEISGIFAGQTVARQVTIEQFFLHLVRHKDGGYNVAQLMQELFPDRKEPLRYSLNNVAISASRLVFDDEPTGKTHTVEEINLAVPSFSNISYQAGQYIKPRFAAKINGSPLNLTGETSMTGETMQASLDLNFNNIDLPRYLDYLPENWRLRINKGTAEFTGKLVFSFAPKADARLNIEGAGSFSDLAIQDREGNIHNAEKISFSGSLTPLERRYLFQEIELQGPTLFLDKDKKGAWSFLSQAGSPPGEAQKIHLRIGQLVMHNGTLHLTDRQVKGGFRHTWSDLQLTIKGYDDQGDTPAAFALSGKSGASARLSAQGSLTANPLQAEGLLVINQMDLGRFSPYLGRYKDLKIVSGFAKSVESRFTWTPALASPAEADGFVLAGLKTDIEKLTLATQKEEWLRLPVLHISEAALDRKKQSLHLGKIKAEKASLLLAWDKDGRCNWAAVGTSAGKGSRWHVTLATLSAGKSAINLRSAAAKLPALEQRLDGVEALLELSDPASRKGVLTLTATANGSGTLSLEGPLQLSPFEAAFTCRLEKLPLASAAALFKGWLKPAISGGELQANGTIRLPEATFTGGVSIGGLVAGSGKNPILSWQNAYTENITADLKTASIDIGQLFVESPVLRWRREANASMRAILFQPRKSENGAAPVSLSIKEVSLGKGTVFVSDQKVSPAFEGGIGEVNGTITDLANKAESICRLDLNGIVNNRAPLILSGDFRLFAPNIGADCKIGLSGAALTELSPYVEPVLGYQPTAGSLKLVSILKKEENTLNANSQITITGLRLGQVTDGSRLLPLTVALLADEQEEFTMNVSSSGDLNDKDFSYAKALAKHLRSLLAKTGASPFTVLNESLPNITVPTFLPFKAGQTAPDEAGQQELNTIGEVLQRRPGLKLVVSGSADDQADRRILFEKLRRQEEERRKKAEAQLSQKMAAAYGKEEIAKPGSPGQPQGIVEEKAIEESSVRKEDLLRLAEERAANTRQYLMDRFKIPAKRLGLAAARILGADNPLAAKSRVDFTLDRAGQ
ncbi:DUF748 domain-containing protein [Thiovibrio sp. JS02]